MSKPIVSLQHVEKWYGSNHVVKDMNLEIEEGEFLTLLGPSGCGKTTTLRMIAGFEDANSGVIEVQGERVEEKEPYQRDVNTVFQSYSLFPHMTVYDNVAYGPAIRKVPKAEIRERVAEMLSLVQMSGYENRKPDALSGGQKQRVAIARALINNPRVLLLDEPLGALDLKLRKQMQIELKRLQKKLGITFVYVTHDQEEAMTMSDRIAVMREGIILQIDSPLTIYGHPNCRFVADFIGESNVIEGTVTAVSGVGGKIEAVKRFILGNKKRSLSSTQLSLTAIQKTERFYGTTLPGIYEDNLSPAATKTRGYIKIQDGCDNFCSYCRIPYLRGRSRSRKVDSIVREAQEVATHSKEIILTGINVSDYYSSGSGLTELVYALKDIPARKRLSSLECEVVDERLLVALKECGFCDHFHLSLQSGSDAVLKRMNRHYTVEEYLEKVELIYKHFPEAAITTDMIAGFPTETEEDHIIGMETARKAKFAAIHVFPYSEREGTTAAKLPQLEKAIRSRRAGELIKLGAQLKENFIQKNIGRVADVYAETEENGISEGFTTNYIKIYSPLKSGEMGKVKLIEPYQDGIKGELV